jgi:hypothetical protein
LRIEDGDQLLDFIDHLDHVASRLAKWEHADRANRAIGGVQPGNTSQVLLVVYYGRDVFEVHRLAVAPGHRHRPIVRGIHQLSAGLDVEGVMRPDQSAGGYIDVPVLNGLRHLIDADLPGGELAGIHLDVDGKFGGSKQTHLRDAVDGGDPLRHQGLGVLVEDPQRQGSGSQTQEGNRRIGRIAFAERGRARHSRRKQRSGRVDGGDEIDGRAIDAAGQIEL